MKLTYEEAVELLRGLMHICLESSASDLVEEDEKHVYGLLARVLMTVVPVFEEQQVV